MLQADYLKTVVVDRYGFHWAMLLAQDKTIIVINISVIKILQEKIYINGY